MHIFERFCKTVRSSCFLRKANWFWNVIRPFYEMTLNIITFHGGIERIVNGTDRILVPVLFRWFTDVYEPKVWEYLMARVRTGDTVADVGAYIGLYSVALARRIGPSGKAFAFEPDPVNFLCLKKIIELNRVSTQVEPLNIAVADRDGDIVFSADQGTDSHISLSPMKGDCLVRCMRLDTFFSGRRLDILKIDVEGFEEFVIKGGVELFNDSSRRPRVILIEVHPYAWPEIATTSKSLLSYFPLDKYMVLDLNGCVVKEINSYGWIFVHSINHRTI